MFLKVTHSFVCHPLSVPFSLSLSLFLFLYPSLLLSLHSELTAVRDKRDGEEVGRGLALGSQPPTIIMRVRLSRKLGLLAKAGMVLWLMWLSYLIVTHSVVSTPSSSSSLLFSLLIAHLSVVSLSFPSRFFAILSSPSSPPCVLFSLSLFFSFLFLFQKLYWH